MHLQDDFLFLEEVFESAFVYARDPLTNSFAQERALPYNVFLPCALRVRDGLVARAGCGASGFPAKLLIHRRTIGSSGAPELALQTETLFPGVQRGFRSIDVQGERVVLGAPEQSSYAGEVLVIDLACPRAQVPAALVPR
jgi:hypothetical protein